MARPFCLLDSGLIVFDPDVPMPKRSVHLPDVSRSVIERVAQRGVAGQFFVPGLAQAHYPEDERDALAAFFDRIDEASQP